MCKSKDRLVSMMYCCSWASYLAVLGTVEAAIGIPRVLVLLQVVQRMIGAFEGRCRQLYGPSSLYAKHAVGRQ